MSRHGRLMDPLREPIPTVEAAGRRRALELILRERRRLLGEVLAARGVSPDPLEVAQELEEQQVWLAVLDQSQETQVQVDEARQLLTEGRYGTCVACGEPIPPARLCALPFALRCLTCQERFEARRRPATSSVTASADPNPSSSIHGTSA